jgi:hypothetical protein
MHRLLVALALFGALLPPSAAAQTSSAVTEDFSEEQVGAPPTSFSTPTGFWSIGTDGTSSDPLLFEDGSQWPGSQAAEGLVDQARSLYGDRWQQFVDDLPGTAYFPIAIYKKVPSFSQGSVTTRFAIVGGDVDQDAGILFGYRPNGDFLALRIDADEGEMKLYQWVQGQPNALKVVQQVPATLARWHELKVVVSGGGSHVAGYLDTRKYLETDVDPPVSGQVGAWSKTDTVVLYQRFAVDPDGQ